MTERDVEKPQDVEISQDFLSVGGQLEERKEEQEQGIKNIAFDRSLKRCRKKRMISSLGG